MLLNAFSTAETQAQQGIQSQYVGVYLPICGCLPTNMWVFTYLKWIDIISPINGIVFLNPLM
jgi:hypothetical protein